MRGHITKRAKNSYSIAISLGKDSTTGKYKYQWVSVKGTKKDAEKRLSELIHQLDSGTFIKPSKITLAEYLERWLREYAWANLAPRTAEGYELIVRRHLMPALGNITLTGLKEAVKLGLLNRNVADAVSPPSCSRYEWQYFNEFDFNTFLETAKKSPYYVLFYLALFTGMRRSEILALRWRDVDLVLCEAHVSRSLHQLQTGEIVIRSPKSKQGLRTVDLPLSTALLLQEYKDKHTAQRATLGIQLNENDLIFSDIEGKPLLPNTVTHAWIKLVRRTGLKGVRLHDARHTHASLMLKQGIHPKIVQERLGHASIQMTLDTYSHMAREIQKAAAESFDSLVSPKSNGTYEKGLIEKHY